MSQWEEWRVSWVECALWPFKLNETRQRLITAHMRSSQPCINIHNVVWSWVNHWRLQLVVTEQLVNADKVCALCIFLHHDECFTPYCIIAENSQVGTLVSKSCSFCSRIICWAARRSIRRCWIFSTSLTQFDFRTRFDAINTDRYSMHTLYKSINQSVTFYGSLNTKHFCEVH